MLWEKRELINLLTLSHQNFLTIGAWIEQLIAESTGKVGKGILPVDLESIEDPEFYSSDRLFVYIKLKDDTTYDGKVEKIKSAGFPILELELEHIYDLVNNSFYGNLQLLLPAG